MIYEMKYPLDGLSSALDTADKNISELKEIFQTEAESKTTIKKKKNVWHLSVLVLCILKKNCVTGVPEIFQEIMTRIFPHFIKNTNSQNQGVQLISNKQENHTKT